MAFTHKDLLDLNHVAMADAPIVTSGTDIQKLYLGGANMSVAGMRHSQGGHTALADGHMLITETMNRTVDFEFDNSGVLVAVTVDAGMTWAELHYHLSKHNAAPIVHQSSAHFSIGGSLSVNCHGREIEVGAVSGTVLSIEVLTGASSTPVHATPTFNSELFRAVIGGYGTCGVILKAKLRVTENAMFYRVGYDMTLPDYQALLGLIEKNKSVQRWQLHRRGDTARPAYGLDPNTVAFKGDDLLKMHYGWIDVSDTSYLSAMVSYDTYKADKVSKLQLGSEPSEEKPLKFESWGDSELLRAGWKAAEQNGAIRRQLWAELKQRTESEVDMSRLDFMREAITFTSSRGTTNYVTDQSPSIAGMAMLQEYFVPLEQFVAFMAEYKRVFPYNDGLRQPTQVQLLSTTTRFVREDAGQSYLSYAPDGKARVSIALEAYVPFIPKTDLTKVQQIAIGMTYPAGDSMVPHPDAVMQFQAANKAALDCGGSYYLPYYSFATQAQFNSAYGRLPNYGLLQQAIRNYNPSHRFSNEFLKHYGIH